MSLKKNYEYFIPIPKEEIIKTSKANEVSKEEEAKLVEAYSKKDALLCSYNDKPILWTQLLGTICFSSVSVATAVILGFTGTILPAIMNPQSEDELILNTKDASLFSSIVYIGAIFGSVMSSLINTWLGQRSTLLVFLPAGIAIWVVIAFSKTFWLLILSRFVHGIVFAVIQTCVDPYIGEIAHLRYRGRFAGLAALARQLGYLFIFLVGSSYLTWRNAALICGITSMSLPFLGATFLPHSPRWLSIKDRKVEARKALIFFRGKEYNVDSELNDIQEQLNSMSKGAKVWDQFKLLITNRNLTCRFGVLALLRILTSFNGSYASVAYAANIFMSANVVVSPYLCSIVIASVRIVAVSIYILLADRLRRRITMLTTMSLSGLSMFAMSSYFFMKDVWELQFNWLPLASMVIFVFFIVIYQSAEALLIIELLPMPVRSVGFGLLSLILFTSHFCAAISYPLMVMSVGSGWTFLLYTGVCVAVLAIIAVAIPETKGKKLEEI